MYIKCVIFCLFSALVRRAGALHIFIIIIIHVLSLGEENSNSKTLFYKDCSLGSVENLTTIPC